MSWSGGPPTTKSYAVIALNRNEYPIWGIYDIPVSVTSLPAGIERAKEPAIPAGSKQTDFAGYFGYKGACDYLPGSPVEPTYQFIVYARSIEHEDSPLVESWDDFTVVDVLQSRAVASSTLQLVQPRANGSCTPD